MSIHIDDGIRLSESGFSFPHKERNVPGKGKWNGRRVRSQKFTIPIATCAQGMPGHVVSEIRTTHLHSFLTMISPPFSRVPLKGAWTKADSSLPRLREEFVVSSAFHLTIA